MHTEIFKRLFLTVALTAGCCCAAVAADFFAATQNGTILAFNIIDEGMVEVSHVRLDNGRAIGNQAPGDLVISEMVSDGGNTYSVVGIGPKAFTGDVSLVSVTLPESVTHIGDFAFEGCTSLKKVVLPPAKVVLEEGVFFGCPALEEVTFGEGIDYIDGRWFAWTPALKSLTIPASVTEIVNLKAIPGLTTVNVAEGNENYASRGGLLYTAGCETLGACPNAYTGALTVDSLTTEVLAGALDGCAGITTITFPAGLQRLTIDELRTLTSLSEVRFQGQPFVNAYSADDQSPRLVLWTPTDRVKVNVPRQQRDAWRALFVTRPGSFSLTPEPISPRYTVTAVPRKLNTF